MPDYASEIISGILHEIFQGIAVTPLPGHLAHHAYVSTEDDVEATEQRLQDALSKIAPDTLPAGRIQLQTDWVEDTDWAEQWKQYYQPMRVGDRLLIVPSWRPWPDPQSSLEPRDDDLVIRLDPGMAFGTGSHSSTRMCMEALEDHLSAGDRVIDVGCGSGILSITAAKLGAESVLGVDNDPVCVKIAADNTFANEVGDRCQILLQDNPAQVNGTFEIYVSNINERVICRHLPAAVDLLTDGGIYICSGITHRSTDTVTRTIAEAGLEQIGQYAEGEWRCLVAQKRG